MCISESQFLYIVVLHQLQLVELSRFQYYLDYDCMFDLFDCIKVYSCEVLLLLSQSISELCLWLIELYLSCHEVKNSLINLLHSMSKDLLQINHNYNFFLSFTKIIIFNIYQKIDLVFWLFLNILIKTKAIKFLTT